jgi:hypothetical protein
VTGSPSDSSGTRRDVLLLGASALAFRVLFQIAYTPLWTGDGPGYAVWWVVAKNHLWQFYDGLRPPIYPLLLGLVEWLSGSAPLKRLTPEAGELVVSFQQIAGVIATTLLYLALRNLGVRRRVSFWSCFFYALLVPACLAEMTILPLALTSSLLIAALWLFTVAIRRSASGRSALPFAAASGLTFALAALTRAEILAFLIVFAGTAILASLIYRRKPGFTALRSSALIAIGCAAPLILGWMSFNARMIGRFTFTTGRPLNATCTVYDLFDRVEPEDLVFGQIMLKYYRGADRIDLLNDALPELRAHASEMPLERKGPFSPVPDLYVYAGQVSHRLQRNYPGHYLQNAIQSFSRTFDFSQGGNIPQQHVKDPESLEGKSVLENKVVAGITDRIRWMEAPLMLALYCMMLLSLPVALLGCYRKRFNVTIGHVVVFAIALATFGTLVAFSLLHTYFPHYGLVFFGCIVLCGAAVGDSIAVFVKGRRAGTK